MSENSNHPLGSAGSVFKVILARLRFVAVFLVAALVVGYWDTIKTQFDKWTRPKAAPDALQTAAEVEFYCPMHPNVVRQVPRQCPVCGMPLVKRLRGEQTSLPQDVLARVQLTPQRIALAGITTQVIEARSLV